MRFAGILIVALACLSIGRPAAQSPSVTDLLDRYYAGRFDSVVAALNDTADFESLLADLKRDAPAWIEQRGPAEHPRRQLAAATFALEAARVDEWREWKWIQRQPEMKVDAPAGAEPNHSTPYKPLALLTWRAAPLLVEWGCALMRQDETPRPVERWWQLASLAVAERSEDAQFLIGDPEIGIGVASGEISNTKSEIKHLDHALARFPEEMRFQLAQGIAREWLHGNQWQDEARMVFESLKDHVDLGGEATLRLGRLAMDTGKGADALKLFDRVEDLTRDPYVIYLARFFAGQIHEHAQRPANALAAYRGAAAAVPNAEAASVALAAALFRDGKRSEAQQIAGAMLDADPAPADPWREYVHADDRFWSQMLGHLRAEIHR